MNAVERRLGFHIVPGYAMALLLLAIAVPLVWMGWQLAVLGGSSYYVVAGVALATTAVLLVLRRAAALVVYGILLALTIVWALWEAGPRFWPLLPRLGIFLALGAILALPIVWEPLSGWPRFRVGRRRGAAVVAAVLVGSVVAGLGMFALSEPLPAWPIYRVGMANAPAVQRANVPRGDDWLNYGNDLGGSRFSPLDQINTTNVSRLEVAWTYRVGPDAKGNLPMMEVNPLKIGDSVFVCTAYGDIISLDAESGRENWRYRSGRDMSWTPNVQCRGLGY